MKTTITLGLWASLLCMAPGVALADPPGTPLGPVQSPMTALPVSCCTLGHGLAQHRNGDLLVAYSEKSGPGESQLAIRRISRTGAAIGGPSVVANPPRPSAPFAVATGKGGAGAIAWKREGYADAWIYLQRVNAAGQAVGGVVEVQAVNDPGRLAFPKFDSLDVDIGETGVIAVNWTSYFNYVRMYSPLGQPLGTKMPAGDDPAGELKMMQLGIWPHRSASRSTIVADRLNGFLTSWADGRYVGSEYQSEPFSKRLSAAGTWTGPKVAGGCVAPLAQGDYFTARSGPGNVLYVQRYNAAGLAKGGAFGGMAGGCDEAWTDSAGNLTVRNGSSIHMFSSAGALLASFALPLTPHSQVTSGWAGELVHTWVEPAPGGMLTLRMQRYAGPLGGVP